MYEEIIEQLSSSCDCISDNEWESSKLESNITEFLDLISTMTCWKTKACENFLSSEREEVFDVDIITDCRNCDSGLVVKTLYFDEVQTDSIEVKILIRNRLEFEEIEIPSEDFAFNPYTGELYVDLSDYAVGDACTCDKVIKMIVTYVAGYETLPDCLLPVLCDYLDYVIDMNKCSCSCSVCDSDSTSDVVIEEPENDEYISIKLRIRNMITENYMRQLEFISLCGTRKYLFTGMVV